MAILTTGVIENPTVAGQKQTATLSVRYRNTGHLPAVIQIWGYYLQGSTKVEYVVDSITLASGVVKDTQHYAQFDALEFRFMITSQDVKLKVWGKNVSGTMTAIYPVRPVDPISSGQIHEQGKKATENQLYAIHPERNSVDVLDKSTRAPIMTIPVGINPQGIGINPLTGRVYVSNYGSNTVTVIDGSTNSVIATVLVGASPAEIRVDSKTNRIYVTNQGSGTVSVINGTTHTVMSTLKK